MLFPVKRKCEGHKSYVLISLLSKVDEVYRCLGDDFPVSIRWNKSLDTILLTFPQCEESVSDYRLPEKDYAAKVLSMRHVFVACLIYNINWVD